MPENKKEDYDQQDHDLLIRIDEKLNLFIKDFSLYKEYASKQMHEMDKRFEMYVPRTEVEHLKKDADESHRDYEKRIRRLEKWVLIATGALVTLQLILQFWGPVSKIFE